MRLVDQYRRRHDGWSAKHFYAWYRRDGGTRSYTCVKSRLQEAQLVPKAKQRGAHRKRRERSPLPGMLLHQDGSTHEWVPGQQWDLIVTMDDATNEHYSMFFVDEEGTLSSLRGVREVIAARGLFCALYTDRDSHYWTTSEAGGKVDKVNLTQFGEVMKRLGIDRRKSHPTQVSRAAHFQAAAEKLSKATHSSCQEATYHSVWPIFGKTTKQ
jgi:hypothetical protein